MGQASDTSGVGSRDGGGTPQGGSGDGGPLGTPSTDTVEEPAGGTQEGMVVSGGGLADPSEDDATAAGERGLG